MSKINPPPRLGNIDVRKIRSWLNDLRDYTISLPSRGDGKTIRVNAGTISAVPQPTPTSGGVSGGGEYNGAFKVEKLTDTSVKIRGYEGGWKIRNYIVLGLSRIEFAATTLSNITSSCYVYITITYSNNSYSCTAGSSVNLPSQDNSHIYHPLAFVTCSNNAIVKITQLQYGIIHYPARFL